MGIKLGYNAYGKNAVQLSKIERYPSHHIFREISVDVQLKGDFALAHLEGDNNLILPTDTQKNTIYVLAKNHFTGSIEAFAIFLGKHFIDKNPQVDEVKITISEKSWKRLDINGESYPHTFIEGSNEQRFTEVTQGRGATRIISGIKDLLILKTTDSGFEKFLKDEYTVLPETSDRIMASKCEASWTYSSDKIDFDTIFVKLREILLHTFAIHKSLSVQHTLYAMGEAVLRETAEVSKISLVMPNKHHIPFNLGQFGIENKNEIFMVTDVPFGYITGTVVRTMD